MRDNQWALIVSPTEEEKKEIKEFMEKHGLKQNVFVLRCILRYIQQVEAGKIVLDL